MMNKKGMPAPCARRDIGRNGRSILAGALAAVSALALTACQPGGQGQTAPTAQRASASETGVPTTTPVPTLGTPATAVALSEIQDDRYADLSNESRGWWYRVPEPPGEGIPAGIDESVEQLLAKYEAVWQIPPGRKTVYMTMDEGYELPGNTEQLLAVAREKQFKIHFFVTGGYVEDQPELVQQMVDEGHIVCNHSMMHLAGPDAVEESGVQGLVDDVVAANDKFKALTGKDMVPMFRPPTGAYSERTLAVIRDLGYHPVFWSFAYRDWLQDDQPDPDEAVQTILGQLHDGSVILMHANSRTNAEIMGRVVDGIRERGFELGSLEKLLAEGYERVMAEPKTPADEHSGAASGAGDDAAGNAEIEPPAGTPYTVQAGDTLWGIASERYPDEDIAAVMQRIAELNGADDADSMRIALGETIWLP